MKIMTAVVLGILISGTAMAGGNGQERNRGGGDNTNKNANLNGNLNLNGNSNRNLNGNKNRNSNRNSATGVGLGVGLGVGISKAYGGEADAKAYGGNAKQGQKQAQQQGQANEQASSNNGVSIVEEHDYQEIPVATAWAPPTQITAPCVIGASAGGQVADYGISFGGGFVDEECVLNRDIALFKSMGASDALMHQVMCQKASYRTASANIAGVECPEYENENLVALRPIRDRVFKATSRAEIAAAKPSCFIGDNDCNEELALNR